MFFCPDRRKACPSELQKKTTAVRNTPPFSRFSAATGGIGFAAVGCRICVIGAKTADHYSGDDDNPPEVIVIAATVVEKHFDHLITGYVKFRKVLRYFFCNKNTAKNI